MNIFESKNIYKTYTNHTALEDVSIQVPKGTIFGLLGPNGAGKTTLIRIINQISFPDSGELLFDGKKMTESNISDIGYLPEERGLYRKMEVGEQALYLAQLKNMPRKEALKQLKYWFEKFEITHWWNKKIEELSKGMQQKVQFIITILHQPKLLILDEPFSGFDPINTNIIKKEILKLKDNGATVILSTHNMFSVEEICDHIALINNSRKILDGPIEHIRKSYRLGKYKIVLSPFDNDVKLHFSDDLTVLEQQHNDGSLNITIQADKSKSPNSIIQQALNFGEVTMFQEVIPSMNDVFIQTVNNNISSTKNSHE